MMEPSKFSDKSGLMYGAIAKGEDGSPRTFVIGVMEPDEDEGFDGAVGKMTQYGALTFQDGPVKEVGRNGVTESVILEIALKRLDFYQSGKYACRENAIAITKIEEALMWLESRTRNREARGVEGTSHV